MQRDLEISGSNTKAFPSSRQHQPSKVGGLNDSRVGFASEPAVLGSRVEPMPTDEELVDKPIQRRDEVSPPVERGMLTIQVVRDYGTDWQYPQPREETDSTTQRTLRNSLRRPKVTSLGAIPLRVLPEHRSF